MKEAFSSYDRQLLNIVARVRGLRPETAILYPQLSKVKSVEATRKRFERLEKRGALAKSSLPAGPQIFRLSRKGVQLTGAPPSFADSPTAAIAYEMVATGCCAYRTDEFQFLTRLEFLTLCSELHPGFSIERFPGRFVLRKSPAGNHSPGTNFETHLHFWLAEFKPAEQLAARVDAIINALTKISTLFPEMIQRGLFGISIAVPSEGVGQSLRLNSFPVTVSVIVVPELAGIAGLLA